VTNPATFSSFLTNAGYIGAVRDSGDLWFQGWTCGLGFNTPACTATRPPDTSDQRMGGGFETPPSFTLKFRGLVMRKSATFGACFSCHPRSSTPAAVAQGRARRTGADSSRAAPRQPLLSRPGQDAADCRFSPEEIAISAPGAIRMRAKS
jgi:hypothetical protein